MSDRYDKSFRLNKFETESKYKGCSNLDIMDDYCWFLQQETNLIQEYTSQTFFKISEIVYFKFIHFFCTTI